MTTKPRVVELVKTCPACPSQWEGKTDEGQRVYVRYRHDMLRVDLDGLTIFHEMHDGPFAGGLMSTDDMKRLTARELDWLGVEAVGRVDPDHSDYLSDFD